MPRCHASSSSPWRPSCLRSRRTNHLFRDGCLNRWLFESLREAREASEAWLRESNHERPHGSLEGLTPFEFSELWEGQERVAA